MPKQRSLKAMTQSETTSYTIRVIPSDTTSTTSCKKKEGTDTEWINDVREKVNSSCLMDHCSNPCTIFKVPQHIRHLDDKAYDPVVASFGPLHHRNPNEHSVLQHHKWRCAWHLLSHHRSPEQANRLLDKCLSELKKEDDNVRGCYSEELSALNARYMALIMLLDGCFIIYLMLKWKESTETREGEVVLNIEGKEKLPECPTVAGLFTVDLVVHDLLKLENQIPFFIIQLLFDNLKAPNDGDIDLVDLALHLFKDIHPKQSKSFKKKSSEEYHHLLHLFYSSRILSEKPAVSTSTPGSIRHAMSTFAPESIRHAIEHIELKWKEAKAIIGCEMSKWKKLKPATRCKKVEPTPEWIPSATELDRAGVKFKKKRLSKDSFLNITFEWRKMNITPLLCLLKLCLMFRSGQMEIPPLRIYDYTGPLFRNLIAFEQCYHYTEMYITIYALFMDCIIDKAEDVRLLHLVGILEHKLSSDQAVAELFNKLGCHIHFVSKKNYLASQIDRVNKFYDSSWHKWLAALRRDYLRNPWTIISVLAAIFLLLLTIEQSIFAALSYFHSS